MFDADDNSWSPEPNKMGLTPLYGPSGFGNTDAFYTWSMEKFRGDLYVGTLDVNYTAQAFETMGADLYRFNSAGGPPETLTLSGFNNPANYGFRTMEADRGSMYLGTAGILNLATNDQGTTAGGWELHEIHAHPSLPDAVTADFDMDAASDIGCYNDATGAWYFFGTTSGFFETVFGYDGTIPLNGDFDGDGAADFGCHDPVAGKTFLFKSTEGFRAMDTTPGRPVTGDFDGDGVDDLGTYDDSRGLWTIYCSTREPVSTVFGYSGTRPITGDFDGDGTDDFGCYDDRNGMWYIFRSTQGFWQTQFGYLGTLPVTGDFDGDGTDDFGCYDDRTGMWYLFQSTAGFRQTQFGYLGTLPIVGDYDGDGTDDFGCYYPTGGNWYMFRSTLGFWETQFGYHGTVPVSRITP